MPLGYLIALDVWLFLTVLFANFATALAEARGRRRPIRFARPSRNPGVSTCKSNGKIEEIASTFLKAGDRSSSRLDRSFPVTAKSSKASLRLMNPRSPANPPL